MLFITEASFIDLVKKGKAIENGIKTERVTNFVALQEFKARTMGVSKKEKKEVTAKTNIQK